MNGTDRRTEQELFMKHGKRNVMIATSAFGLGIDKQDFRYVVHFQTPASMEQYVQEAGRVGRDGKRAHCILLHNEMDRDIHEFLLSQSRVNPAQLFNVATALAAYVEEKRDPDVVDLAASSRVSQRVTAATVAMFETAGLVHISSGTRSTRIQSPNVAEASCSASTSEFRSKRSAASAMCVVARRLDRCRSSTPFAKRRPLVRRGLRERRLRARRPADVVAGASRKLQQPKHSSL
jgi:superfamily II DNA helicase RecQ